MISTPKPERCPDCHYGDGLIWTALFGWACTRCPWTERRP